MSAATTAPRIGRTIPTTRWRSLTDATDGREIAMRPDELGAWLELVGPHGPGWSAARFRDGHRKKENVLYVTALVVDIDKGAVTLDTLRVALSGVAAIVHSTRSSTPAAPRWRVVILTTRDVTAAEYGLVWGWGRNLFARSGIVIDPAAKDASRFWFCPSQPAEGEYICATLEGEPLDVDESLADAVRSSATPPPPPPSGARGAGYGAAALADACARVASASEGERNATLNKESYYIAQLVSGGEIDWSTARSGLAAAARRAGLDQTEIDATLASAFEAGGKNPRTRPPRSTCEREGPRPADDPDGDQVNDDAAPDHTKRPNIEVTPDIHDTITESIAALCQHPGVYQRDGKLVQVLRAPDTETIIAPGAPVVRQIPEATAREMLTTVASFQKYNERKEEWVATMPNDAVVKGVVQRGEWPGIRPLVGVLEAPSIRPDGTIIQRAGYDERTGYLLLPSVTFPAVPESPTQADAAAALAELEEVFCDFPMVDGASRSVPLAALLTIMARPAIVGSTPAVLLDANLRGGGKTLMADAVSIIATGRATAKMSYPGDDIELEKVLGAYAIRGAGVINFDNVTRPFGGGPIDRCLTAVDEVELRVLGKSEIPTLRWRAVVMATGNNMSITGDTARRVLVSRIESPLENPEDRVDLRHSPLLPWVTEHRPRLVRAALTVLRAWFIAEKPAMGCKTWGSFEAWAELIPPALVFAGAPDPMLRRAEVAGVEDEDRTALLGLLENWGRVDNGDGVTVRELLAKLYPIARKTDAAPDGFEDLRAAVELVAPSLNGKPPEAKKLGKALSRFKGRNVGGKRLRDKKDRTNVVRWKVEACRV